MAVFELVELPDQPSSGSTRIIPLGGDGLVSPFQMLEFHGILTGDATGGTNILNVAMDPTVISVVSWMRHLVVNAAAAWSSRLDIRPRGVNDLEQTYFGDALLFPATHSGYMLSPVPELLELVSGNEDLPHIAYNKANVDTESVVCDAMIYQFNLEARLKSPIEHILGSIPKGFSWALS